MKRALALGVVALAGVAAACSALLGLEDRTLRDAGADADAGDAQTDVITPCADSGFCACSHHDFCEDFEEYKSPQELSAPGTLWTNMVGYPSPVVFPPSSFTFDYATVAAPSPPNALFATAAVTFGKGGGAILFGQVDSKVNHTKPVIGLSISMLMLVDSLVPDDAAVPLADSGAHEVDNVLAVVDALTNDGVGIALSDVGGFIGYALNLNTFSKTTLGQGSQFTDKAVPPTPIFLPIRMVIAPRDAIEVGQDTVCKQGPFLSLGDGGVDASIGPNPMVVVIFPPAGTGQITCEILGGSLLDPTWVAQAPLIAVGGIQSGLGTFKVVFDNITLDFLEQ